MGDDGGCIATSHEYHRVEQQRQIVACEGKQIGAEQVGCDECSASLRAAPQNECAKRQHEGDPRPKFDQNEARAVKDQINGHKLAYVDDALIWRRS